nr:hypothetical protein [uncultured Tolumonas sp.]
MFKDKKFLITIILAIIPIVAPNMWDYFASKNKDLSFEMLSQLNLSPSIEGDVSLSDIKVSIAGKNIESPYVSYIKIENKSRSSISKSDYESPLIIEVSKDQKIIRSSIVDKQPGDIDTEIKYDANKITLSPSLLNPGDNMFIQILTENGTPKLTVHGRINGVNKLEITKSDNNQINLPRTLTLFFTILLLSIPTTTSVINFFTNKPTHKMVNGFQTIASIFGIEILSIFLSNELYLNGFQYFLLIILVYIIISMPLGYFLNKYAQA